MSASKGVRTYKVAHSTPMDEESVPAGVMAIDAEQNLEVVSAEPDFAEDLDHAAEMMNSANSFLLHATGPDDSRAVHKRVVDRTAADAREALIEVLRQKYGFELTPAD